MAARVAAPGSWSAGILLYAGRPDPTWTLPAGAASLTEHFEGLATADEGQPDQSRLGYRGVWLRAPDGRRWLAFGGVAWLADGTEIRRDEGRRFERAVLQTAPAGVVPKEAAGLP